MFGTDRQGYRQFFIDCRKRQLSGARLEPLEQMIVQLLDRHPEYQVLLDRGDQALEQDFLPEMGQTNPFLHLGLHISLIEQLNTDRPPGIRSLYQQLCQKLGGDTHAAEHLLMERLAETLYQAQRQARVPDETAYLADVQGLLRRLPG